MTVTIFDFSAFLLTLAAIFGWINLRLFKLPNTVGIMLMGVTASLLLLAGDMIFPDQTFYQLGIDSLRDLDFAGVVMDGMLAFLLFAGAFGVDIKDLRSRAGPVLFLAVIGTLISTVVVGSLFWLGANAVGQSLSLPWALVFGALISPTDPVAVLNVLKTVKVPLPLQVEMQGEALFNDGVGIVLFSLLVTLASGSGDQPQGAVSVIELIGWEAGGGLALGMLTGYVAYRAMRAIDDHTVEVLITLALVMGTYALAHQFGMSGPLSMVSAGLLIGNPGRADAMSENTARYVAGFWMLIDEILNAMLFLLIGLEVLLLGATLGSIWLALIAIPIVLLARLVATSTPLLLFPWSIKFSAYNVSFLTWAGVRGGISIALALSLPDDPAKSLILAATYAVVLFSITVQGSSLGWVARKTLRAPKD